MSNVSDTSDIPLPAAAVVKHRAPPSPTDSDVVDRIILTPDPGLVAGLGANHSLPTAMADLIDNAIDAGATRVIVKFITRQDRLTKILVIDDGKGMNDAGINGAMTLGKQRQYDTTDLGHFGLGLKAAALGKAQTLTVYSEKENHEPVGRRLRKQDMGRDYSCEVLSSRSSRTTAEIRRKLTIGPTGTVIELSDLTSTYTGKSRDDARQFLDETVQDIRRHLGIIFHRLIQDGRLNLTTDIASSAEASGVSVPVKPIDPFGYAQSGVPGWPRELRTTLSGRKVTLNCHIWPAKSQHTAFRLSTPRGVEAQGIYVYRGDRLLQVGGWVRTMPAKKEYQLARVALEYSEVEDHLEMNPEKSTIGFSDTLARAIHRATDGQFSFTDYLSAAADAHSASQKRPYSRKPAVRVEKGLGPALKRSLQEELGFDEGQEAISIRWRSLPRDELLDVDFKGRTLWLNTRHRTMLAGPRTGINDAPVLKTMLYLLTREIFMREYQSARVRDDIDLWTNMLGSAIQAELDFREP